MFESEKDSDINKDYLWGSYHRSSNHSNSNCGLTQIERDILTRFPKPLTLEGPRIHEPKIKGVENRSVQFDCPDPYVRNGIKLLAHLRKPGSEFPELSPIKTTQVLEPFGYIKREETNFTLGKSTGNQLRFSSSVVQQILRKSIGSILAFIGFEFCTEGSLDILTDVVSDYFKNFCRHLRYAQDRECLEGSTGFPDVMERVFHDLNIGSVLKIQEYYENSVIKYYSTLLVECGKVSSSSPTRMNAEIVMGDDDIPEIHFPSSEEGGDEHNTPQLETGLQMLQSLEQAGSMIPSVDEQQPLSHDSNSALLLATVSPGAAAAASGASRKRRRTSDKSLN